MINRGYLGVALCIAVCLAGCARSPQTTFYTLSTGAVTLTAVQPKAGPTVAVAAVTLPELVDRPQLVVPDSGNKVILLETHRWAEPLKNAIPRNLADNLARLIGPERVSFAPQFAATSTDYRIFVDLQQFEATTTTVVVDARWTIKPTGAGTTLAGRSHQVIPITGEGYDPLVTAYSKALEKLSVEIARTIPAAAN